MEWQSNGLVWDAAGFLRRFCFSSFLCGRRPDNDAARQRNTERKRQKTKAAEKHRRSPDQTKTKNQSGGEAPPQSRPDQNKKPKRRRSTAAVQTRPKQRCARIGRCRSSFQKNGGEP